MDDKKYMTHSECLSEMKEIELTPEEFKEWVKPQNSDLSIDEIVTDKEIMNLWEQSIKGKKQK